MCINQAATKNFKLIISSVIVEYFEPQPLTTDPMPDKRTYNSKSSNGHVTHVVMHYVPKYCYKCDNVTNR